MTDAQTQYIGLTLLVIGGLLALLKRKRKFDRVNEFGIERFSSYWSKLGLKIKDGALGAIAIFWRYPDFCVKRPEMLHALS